MKKHLCSNLYSQNDFCDTNFNIFSKSKVKEYSFKRKTFQNEKDFHNDTTNEYMNTKKKQEYKYQLNNLFKQLAELQPKEISQTFSNELREKALQVGISGYLGSRNYQPDLNYPGGYEYTTLKTAQDEIKKQIFGNKFKLDPHLSSYDAAVFNNGNNKIHIAYHGASSNPQFLDEDKADILSVIKGNHSQRNSFKRAETVYLKTLEKYPNHQIELLGTSLGGAKAIHVGETFNVTSTTYNPFLSHIQTPKIVGNAPQNIHRVVTDWATAGALKIPSNSNRKLFHYFENKNPYDFLRQPYQYITSPHNLKQFFQLPKNNKVSKS